MKASLLLFAVLPALLVMTIGGWDRIVPLCCGMGAAVASWAVETIVSDGLGGYGIHQSAGFHYFILVAFTEEFLKWSALSSASCLKENSQQVVQSSLLCAVGFGSVENFMYTSSFWHSLGDSNAFEALSFFRFFMPFSMHVVAGPMLVSGYCIGGFRPIGGFFLATLFHGMYDSVAVLPSPAAVKVAYLMIFMGFVASSLIYRTAARNVKGAGS